MSPWNPCGLRVGLFAAATLFVLTSATAQVATVDASNPPNVVIIYDGGPYIYSPNTPDEPTTVYTDDVLIPGPTSSTLTIEYDLLIDAGIIQGTAGNLDGQYIAQEPTVITSKPDTYSTTPATVYYTPPSSEPAPGNSASAGPFYFDFGTPTSPVAPGYTQISERTAYDPNVGYGWGDITKVSSRNRGVASDPLGSDFCLPSGTPFYVDVTNGTYVVTVLSGDAIQKSGMVVRANGLLELYNMGAPTGKFLQQSFPITVSSGRLRLEFFGSICHVNAITITRVPDGTPHKTTIFVASDSTAAAYTQYQYPLTGWGDRLANFLTSDVVVDDQAKAGRSAKSFLEEGGLDTIMNRIQPGDYLFVMSAINDNAKDTPRHTDPATTYKAYLRLYVNAARSVGATPVFVTSQTKRTYDLWGRFYNSVGAYPQAMHELGAELNVPVIDLNQMSIDFFTQVGPPATRDMFMYFDPGVWPNWPNGDADYIHFQDRGATALARLITTAIQQMNLPRLAPYVIGPPFVARQPVSQTATVGDAVNFSVEATGTPPLSYQWQLNGAPVSGATGAVLTLSNVQLANAGNYSVTVTNASGQSLTSASATLMVNVNAVFVGRAFATSVGAAGQVNNFADTGPLPGAGGARSNSILTISQPGVSADVGHAATIGQADRTRSEASAADFSLSAGGVAISASWLRAGAMAVWQSNGTGLSGDTEIGNLLVGGQSIAVSGQPNQAVSIPGGRITINEQIVSGNVITVNALHVVISGVTDTIIASATAGLVFTPQPPSTTGVDYITGGGWITGTASGAKANFGIDGGIQNGVAWGDLTYFDHGDGLTLKSTRITTYAPGPSANSRHIEGTAQVNGVDGYTFTVVVTDNGEPGTNDTFAIQLSNGYQATGSLGGGNIKLHQPAQ
jgi:lysophospholipase L1-like esterase